MIETQKWILIVIVLALLAFALGGIVGDLHGRSRQLKINQELRYSAELSEGMRQAAQTRIRKWEACLTDYINDGCLQCLGNTAGQIEGCYDLFRNKECEEAHPFTAEMMGCP